MIAALLLSAALLVHPSSGRRVDSPATAAPPALAARPLLITSAVLAAVAMLHLPATMALAAGLVAGTGYLRCRRRRRRRRSRAESRTLAGALELVAAELRAGAHPVRAFEVAAVETAGATGAETGGQVSTGLRTVAARARLGADVVAGLHDVAARSWLPRQWEHMAACWQLAAEHGLPIGVLMRAAHLDIAERQRYAAQVDAGMAGARATAAILAGLPVLGVVLGELVGASPTAFLSTGAGGWVLVVGVLLGCAGVLWSGHITDRLPG